MAVEAIEELPLPPTFQTVESILDLPREELQKKCLVNVIGILTDYQPPLKSKGTDYKCTLHIGDTSTTNRRSIRANIFWSHDEMPHISDVGDGIILRGFKTQDYNGASLISNFGSGITVFHAANIPPWSPNALPRPSFTRKNKQPSPAESNYVAWLWHHLDKTALLDTQSFQERVVQAMIPKQKYSLLKDVKSDQFYDLIGEVIRVFEGEDRGTVYITDYTPNSLFYNNVWGGSGAIASRDGDEYGYVKSRPKAAKDWPGPYGKLSIQLTVYEPQLTFVRENVKVGKWVLLQNVQIKMGSMGGCLEGILRGDRAQEDRVLVHVMSQPEDISLVDPRWKEAVARKKRYWDKFEASKRQFLEEAKTSTGRRKSDGQESEKMNSKDRRKLERQAAFQKLAAIEQKETAEKIDLNSNIKSNHPDKPTALIHDMLKEHMSIEPDSELPRAIPFVNANYRANVRVVDYFPHSLEDFSIGRRETDYAILSDCSDGEDTDPDEDMQLFREGRGYGGQKKWEWRFALQVEQAEMKTKESSEKIWLMVDNPAAQLLLAQDAVNLRQDVDALNQLREWIFHLWGDLEEKKSAFLKTSEGRALLRGRTASVEPTEQPMRNPHKTSNDLPPDSDSDDENNARTKPSKGTIPKPTALSKRDSNAGSGSTPSTENKTLSSAVLALPVHNRGFACCIRQYGVKVVEEDGLKADAGDGLRWERVFGLFGTMISPPDEEP